MTLDPKTQIMVRKHAKLEYKGSCYGEKEPVKYYSRILKRGLSLKVLKKARWSDFLSF